MERLKIFDTRSVDSLSEKISFQEHENTSKEIVNNAKSFFNTFSNKQKFRSISTNIVNSPRSQRTLSVNRGKSLQKLPIVTDGLSQASAVLPANAFVGLTEQERKHIESVMKIAAIATERTKNSSINSRSYFAMQSLSDISNLNADDRRHIAKVIQKAKLRESPFILSTHKLNDFGLQQPSDNNTYNVEALDYKIEEGLMNIQKELENIHTDQQIEHIIKINEPAKDLNISDVIPTQSVSAVFSIPIKSKISKEFVGISESEKTEYIFPEAQLITVKLAFKQEEHTKNDKTLCRLTEITDIVDNGPERKFLNAEQLLESTILIDDNIEMKQTRFDDNAMKKNEINVLDAFKLKLKDNTIKNAVNQQISETQASIVEQENEDSSINKNSAKSDISPALPNFWQNDIINLVQNEEIFRRNFNGNVHSQIGDYNNCGKLSTDSGIDEYCFPTDEDRVRPSDVEISWFEQEMYRMNDLLKKEINYDKGQISTGIAAPNSLVFSEAVSKNEAETTNVEGTKLYFKQTNEDENDENENEAIDSADHVLTKNTKGDQFSIEVTDEKYVKKSFINGKINDDVDKISSRSTIGHINNEKINLFILNNNTASIVTSEIEERVPTPAVFSPIPPVAIHRESVTNQPAILSNMLSSIRKATADAKPSDSSGGISSFGNKFGGFASKFASDALKSTRQASEQIAQRAAHAIQQQTASLNSTISDIDRPKSAISSYHQKDNDSILSAPIKSASQSVLSTFHDGESSQHSEIIASSELDLPPGLEELSMEEQIKILAVMKCAQIDALTDNPEIPLSSSSSNIAKTMQTEIEKPIQENVDSRKFSTSSEALVIQNQAQLLPQSKQVELPPDVDPQMFEGLDDNEREQILAVMRMAAADEKKATEFKTANFQEEQTESDKRDKRVVNFLKNDVSEEKNLVMDENDRPLSPIRNFDQSIMIEDRQNDITERRRSSGYSEDFQKYGQTSIEYGSPAEAPSQILLDKSLEDNMEKGSENYTHHNIENVDDSKQEIHNKNENKKEIEDELIMDKNKEDDTKKIQTSSDDNIKESFSHKQEEIINGVDIFEPSSMPTEEEDEGFWIQPARPEYQIFDDQLEQNTAIPTGRMWTTVFADDIDASTLPAAPIEVEKSQNVVGNIEEINADTVRGCWETQNYSYDSFDQSYRHQKQLKNDQQNYPWHEEPPEEHYEIEMEDPMSPTIVVTTNNAATPLDVSQYRLTRASNISGAQPRPPEITVTVHNKTKSGMSIARQDSAGDDDSDVGTPSTSDEEDYPDQVIEAPSVVPISFQNDEENRELQSTYAQEVLKQIQSFGESADDEFDVQWATISTTTTNKNDLEAKLPMNNFETSKAENKITLPNVETKNVDSTFQEKEIEISQQTQTQSLQPILSSSNPFLNGNDDEDQDAIIVQQVGLDSDDQELAEAEQYFKNRNAYFVHRPGPVYTIPEGEEEDIGIINTDSIYHAREFERRSLHGTTIPEFTKNVQAKKKSIKDQSYTWSLGNREKEKEENEMISLTPIRSAPPPPTNRTALQNGIPPVNGNVRQFATNIAQADDLPLPIHQYVKFNEQSTNSEIFDDHENETTGNELVSTNCSMLFEEDTSLNSPRLKRSPAMILSSDNDNKSGEIFKFSKQPAGSFLKSNENAIVPNSTQSFSTASTTSAISILSTAVVVGAGYNSEMGRRRLPLLPNQQQDTELTTAINQTTESIVSLLACNTTPIIDNFNAFTSQTSVPKTLSLTDLNQSQNTKFDTTAAASVYNMRANTPITIYRGKIPRTIPANTTIVALYKSISCDLNAPNKFLIEKRTSLDAPTPAIIPGATFKRPATNNIVTNVKRHLYAQEKSIPATLKESWSQNRTTINVPPHISSMASRASTETLSQLAFKMELRDTLNKIRAQKLEACEIEANHRLHIITQMINTGILPETIRRSRAEMHAHIPNVVKCNLPIELIRGAKIVTIKKSPITTNDDNSICNIPATNSVKTSIRHLVQPGIQPNQKLSNAQRELYRKFTPPVPRLPNKCHRQDDEAQHSVEIKSTRSIASQCDPIRRTISKTTVLQPIYSFQSTNHRYIPSISSLSQQLRTEEQLQHEKQLKTRKAVRESGTQTLINSETQTENVSGISTDNYLKPKPKKAKDDDSHQKRHRIMKNKYRFNFTESNSVYDMEIKRRQIEHELKQRKHEKNMSMIDLRYLNAKDFYTDIDESLLQSQGYRSLPRIDHLQAKQAPCPQNSTARACNPDFNYNSLPRNYGRQRLYNSNLGMPDFNVSNERFRPQILRADYGNYSKSLFNLPGASENFSQDYMNTYLANMPKKYYSQSMNYIDAEDQNHLNSWKNKTRPETNFLSQYANYLNNKFINENEEEKLWNLYSDSSPISYENSKIISSRIEDRKNDVNFDELKDHSREFIAAAKSLPMHYAANEDQYFLPADNQVLSPNTVYSRCESNYGQPPTIVTRDYGNYVHNRAQSLHQLNNYEEYARDPHTYMKQFDQTSYKSTTLPLVGVKAKGDINDLKCYQHLQRIYDAPHDNRISPLISKRIENCAYDDRLNRVMQQYTANYRRHEKKSAQQSIQERRINSIGRHPCNSSLEDYDRKMILTNKSRSSRKAEIKRLLLTRQYKHENVFKDLGIRVVGGKRLNNGDLGAFITYIDDAKFNEILGEIKIGDQLLEWNGVLLGGKTFEEVERIISASTGEIEIIVKTNSGDDEPRHFQLNKCAKTICPLKTNKYNRSLKKISVQGDLCFSLSYDKYNGILSVWIFSARGLRNREYVSGAIIAPNPFVKVHLLPDKKISNKRSIKYIPNTTEPKWNQKLDFLIYEQELSTHYLELTIWDYDKYNENTCLGQVFISLNDRSLFNNAPRWYPLQLPATQTFMDDINLNYVQPCNTRVNNVRPHYDLLDGLSHSHANQSGSSLAMPLSRKPPQQNINHIGDYNPMNLDLAGYPAI